MRTDTLFREVTEEFRRRKFSAGLMLAMIDLLTDLGISDYGITNYQELLGRFPRREKTLAGGRAVTLILDKPDGSTVSLRPFYNAAERLFRATHKRFDYPSCAPHATQAWSEYEHWMDALTRLDQQERATLKQQIVDYVLDQLPSQEFDPSSVTVLPPVFALLLREFDFSARKGEPSGAAFQGAVFGFIRADNPHLQVEIDKVRVGSKRLQRVGDIDAWDGERLAISAEAKQYELNDNDYDKQLSGFVNEVNKRGAIGLVVAEGIHDGLRQKLADAGVKGLTLSDLGEIVALWDPAKQRIATESVIYYAVHVEKNSVLATRLKMFIESSGVSENPDSAAVAPDEA